MEKKREEGTIRRGTGRSGEEDIASKIDHKLKLRALYHNAYFPSPVCVFVLSLVTFFAAVTRRCRVLNVSPVCNIQMSVILLQHIASPVERHLRLLFHRPR